MFYEVCEVSPGDCGADLAAVIRLAFADVAEEFHLTPQNCQNHPAFLSDADTLDPLYRPGVICFGAFAADGMLSGFAAIWLKGRSVYELTRLCVLPSTVTRALAVNW